MFKYHVQKNGMKSLMKIYPINPVIKLIEKEFKEMEGVLATCVFRNERNGAQSVVGYGENLTPKCLFIYKQDGSEISKTYNIDYTLPIKKIIQKIQNVIIVITKNKEGITEKVITENYDPINIRRNDNRPILKKVVKQTIPPDGRQETVIKAFNKHYESFFEQRN